MRLRWTLLALKDFEQAHDFIAEEDPEAAQRIAQRIFDATQTLLTFPRIGRVGQDEGTFDSWRIILHGTEGEDEAKGFLPGVYLLLGEE